MMTRSQRNSSDSGHDFLSRASRPSHSVENSYAPGELLGLMPSVIADSRGGIRTWPKPDNHLAAPYEGA